MHNLLQDVDLRDLFHNLAEAVAKRVVAEISDQVKQQMVSREEFAKRRGISLRTVDRALAEGRLEFERLGRRVTIPVNAKISP